MINLNQSYRNNQKGFSLVELSIVLIVLGIIGFISIKFISQIGNQALNEKFKSDLQIADSAITGFIYANSRLPCPASSTSDGVEVCGAGNNQGFLPVATLGIESSLQAQRGRPIRYGVYRNDNASNLLDTDLASLKDRYEPFLPNSETSNQSNGLDLCLALRTAGRATTNTATQVNIGTVGTNVAYVIADSGSLDADNNGDLFDGSNGAGVKFEKPSKPRVNNYDDNVKAVGFNELSGRLKCAKVLSETNGAARASYAAYDMWLVSTQYKNYRDFHVHYLQVMLDIAEVKRYLAWAAAALALTSLALAVGVGIITGGTAAIPAIALATAASVDAGVAVYLAEGDYDGAVESLADGRVQQTEAIASLAAANTFKNSKLAIVRALDTRGLIR
jgi:prepilin-type N-terminal cleavage/methylation domain-containing protein